MTTTPEHFHDQHKTLLASLFMADKLCHRLEEIVVVRGNPVRPESHIKTIYGVLRLALKPDCLVLDGDSFTLNDLFAVFMHECEPERKKMWQEGKCTSHSTFIDIYERHEEEIHKGQNFAAWYCMCAAHLHRLDGKLSSELYETFVANHRRLSKQLHDSSSFCNPVSLDRVVIRDDMYPDVILQSLLRISRIRLARMNLVQELLELSLEKDVDMDAVD